MVTFAGTARRYTDQAASITALAREPGCSGTSKANSELGLRALLQRVASGV